MKFILEISQDNQNPSQYIVKAKSCWDISRGI